MRVPLQRLDLLEAEEEKVEVSRVDHEGDRPESAAGVVEQPCEVPGPRRTQQRALVEEYGYEDAGEDDLDYSCEAEQPLFEEGVEDRPGYQRDRYRVEEDGLGRPCHPEPFRMLGRYSKSKIRKTILEYAASAVFATHMDTLLTKYLTLLTPTATLVNDGPPPPPGRASQTRHTCRRRPSPSRWRGRLL